MLLAPSLTDSTATDGACIGTPTFGRAGRQTYLSYTPPLLLREHQDENEGPAVLLAIGDVGRRFHELTEVLVRYHIPEAVFIGKLPMNKIFQVRKIGKAVGYQRRARSNYTPKPSCRPIKRLDATERQAPHR